MHVFLLPEDYSGEKTFTLEGEKYHYLKNVLRLKTGDSFPARDYNGRDYILRIIDFHKNSAVTECSYVEKKTREELPDITLYQCICKGKKMDQIIRQSTEIGVKRIIPVISRYSVPVMDEKKTASRMERWNRIVREAVQQSASPVITEITEPLHLHTLGENSVPAEINLFFHQSPLENRSLHEYLSVYPSSVSLLIGPEGGLAEEEIRLLENRNFYPVYLKTNILRAETAAVYGISTVQNILTEKEHWQKTRM